MFGSRPSDYPQKLGFILTDQFSMMAFASAVETLRMANRLSEKQLYEWVLVSDNGQGVACSNGITVPVDGPLETRLDCVSVTICSGLDVHRVDTALVIPFLRKAASKGLEIGAICTGCVYPRQIWAARRPHLHDPLGKPGRLYRAVPQHRSDDRSLRDRPQALFLFRRDGGFGSDAQLGCDPAWSRTGRCGCGPAAARADPRSPRSAARRPACALGRPSPKAACRDQGDGRKLSKSP